MTTRRRRTGLAVVGILVGLAVAPLGAAAAFAHDSLVQSDPASDSTVKTLTKIDLTFNADPIDRDGADMRLLARISGTNRRRRTSRRRWGCRW